MSKLYNVSSSPHVRSKVTTQSIMFDVAIAMLPAAAYGVYQFKLKALLILIATVAACVLSEYVYEKLMKKPITIADGSALVTGMILALNMPVSIPCLLYTSVVLNDKRVDTPLLKDVPCSEELGVDFTQGSWRGFCIAKGVPEDVKQIRCV